MTKPFSLRGVPRSTFIVGALAFVASAGACYKPDIKSGGFLCSKDYKQECPEGFHCEAGVCLKGSGTDGAVVDRPSEMKTEAGPDLPGDAPKDLGPVDTGPCLASVAGCSPDAGTGICDPLCQTGCGCHEKCSVNTVGTPTCNVPSGTAVWPEGHACDPVSPQNLALQTDDCAPGLVCQDESCGSLCARFCRTDQDCPNSTCSRTLKGGFKFCDVPLADCNPVTALGPSRCLSAQGCYLSPTVTDKTICDCPFNSIKEGEACSFSRECLRGQVCTDALGGGDLRCHPVCNLTTAPSGCPAAETCNSLQGSQVFGFCH